MSLKEYILVLHETATIYAENPEEAKQQFYHYLDVSDYSEVYVYEGTGKEVIA